jgi:hypothetical protein
LLDDSVESAIGVTHDPAVAGCIIENGGKHGGRGGLCAVLREQQCEGGGVKQRHITADDHDIPIEVGGKRSHGNFDGTTGAGNVILINNEDVWHELRECRDNFVALVPNDGNDVVRVQLTGGRHDVPNKFATGKAVQHFGFRGLHARALARSKNNDGEFVFGHIAIVP